MSRVHTPELGADQAPPPGTLVAGKFRVGASLGRGGMGHVVAATNEDSGKEVALKWIVDPEVASRVERFAREARALGRIRHPNVVDVYDVVEHEGRPCLVMERVEGESLASLLAEDEPIAVERALHLAIEIGRGMAAAHACGVIHRDLKPSNVLVITDGERVRVKIIDFGISKLTTEEQGLTVGGASLGTPRYAAPEQVRDASSIDVRADVYALGAILYEMLAGRPPHQHPDPNALRLQILTVAPRPLTLVRDEVSRSLSDVVDRALAKDPNARVPTMDAFVALLTRVRSSSVDLATAETLVDGPRSLDVETLAPQAHAAPTREADTVPDARAHAPTLLDTRPRASVTAPPAPPRDRRPVWLMVVGLLVVASLGITLFRGDSGSANQAVVDEAALDQGIVDHAALDRARVDDEVVDHAALDQGVVDHAVVDDPRVDHAVVDHEAVDHEAADHAVIDHEAVDHEAVDHALVDHEAVDHAVVDQEAADHRVIAPVGDGAAVASGSASARRIAPRPDRAPSTRRVEPPSTTTVVPNEPETTTPPATSSRGGFALEPW